jgi:hypothetical protein
MKRTVEAANQQRLSPGQGQTNLTHDYPGLMRLRQRLTDRSTIPQGFHDSMTIPGVDNSPSPANQKPRSTSN